MDIEVIFNTNDLDIVQFTSFDEGSLKYRPYRHSMQNSNWPPPEIKLLLVPVYQEMYHV